MRTVQNYRDYVRLYLDVDSTDIDDTLVDAWIQEGQSYVLRTMPVWEHLHTSASITTTVDTADYVVALGQIESVQGPSYLLEPLYVVAGDSLFSPDTEVAGDVRYWAIIGKDTADFSTVRLYPTPGAVEVLTARGWRMPVLPTAAGDSPDLPEDFQHIMDLFVLVRACHQQNDFEQGQILSAQFNEELRALIAHYTAAPRRRIVLNGRRSTGSVPRFPFETV